MELSIRAVMEQELDQASWMTMNENEKNKNHATTAVCLNAILIITEAVSLLYSELKENFSRDYLFTLLRYDKRI